MWSGLRGAPLPEAFSAAYAIVWPCTALETEPMPSRPLVTPHEKMPITTLFSFSNFIALPTSFITPASEPALMIHAFVDFAAELRPVSKALSCEGVSAKSCAPPVTVISTSGLRSFQYFAMNVDSSGIDVVCDIVINWRGTAEASKTICGAFRAPGSAWRAHVRGRFKRVARGAAAYLAVGRLVSVVHRKEVGAEVRVDCLAQAEVALHQAGRHGLFFHRRLFTPTCLLLTWTPYAEAYGVAKGRGSLLRLGG